MNGRVKAALFGLGLMAIAPASFAQTYNMDLTGVGNGTVANGVYVSPYVGTISGPGVNYAGYMICDDFNTESYLNSPWTATTANAAAIDGSQKFGSVVFNGVTYTAQQAYNAAGWLANGLVNGGLGNTTTQTNYAFAIWNIFDGQTADPDGGALNLETKAFSAATTGYSAYNVSVFTPNPKNASQEFLVVNQAPEINAASAASGLTLLLGGVMVLRGRRKLQA